MPFEEWAETPYGRCLCRLNEISRQYIILQIAKLHDPASRPARAETKVFPSTVKQQCWTDNERSAVKELTSVLDGLYRQVKDVRNKILAHNDRSVFTSDTPLGRFPKE